MTFTLYYCVSWTQFITLCLCYIVSLTWQPGSGELVFTLASRWKAATVNTSCPNKLWLTCICSVYVHLRLYLTFITNGLLFQLRTATCLHVCMTCLHVYGHPSVDRRPGMRSAVSGKLHVPCTQTSFSDRSFAVAGPHTWNNLPDTILDSSLTFSTFTKMLKTYLFVWLPRRLWFLTGAW